MLRLFGVTGLDRSGRPLAGAAVDRWAATAEDGLGGPDTIGHIAARLWVPDELNSADGLPQSEALFGAGAPLRDARVRVDDIPSFQGTWAAGS